MGFQGTYSLAGSHLPEDSERLCSWSSQPRSAQPVEKASTLPVLSPFAWNTFQLRFRVAQLPWSVEGLRASFRAVHCHWVPGKTGTRLLPCDPHLPNPDGCCTSSAMPFKASPTTEASSCSFLGPVEGLVRKATAFAHGYARLQRLGDLPGSWAGGRVLSLLSLLTGSCCSSLNIQLCSSTFTLASHAHASAHTHAHAHVQCLRRRLSDHSTIKL